MTGWISQPSAMLAAIWLTSAGALVVTDRVALATVRRDSGSVPGQPETCQLCSPSATVILRSTFQARCCSTAALRDGHAPTGMPPAITPGTSLAGLVMHSRDDPREQQEQQPGRTRGHHQSGHKGRAAPRRQPACPVREYGIRAFHLVCDGSSQPVGRDLSRRGRIVIAGHTLTTFCWLYWFQKLS
jgi:hypothetical protein